MSLKTATTQTNPTSNVIISGSQSFSPRTSQVMTKVTVLAVGVYRSAVNVSAGALRFRFQRGDGWLER